MTTSRYIAKRTVQTVLLLWLVLTLLFFLFRAIPGDFTALMLRSGSNPEAVAALRAKWGLDAPLHVQYWSFLKNYLSLNFGDSIQYRQPVLEYVRMKIFNSFLLVAPGITSAFVIGGIVGTIMGTNRGKKLEKYSLIAVMSVGGLPSFFLAILMVIVFGTLLNIFPTSGMLSQAAVAEFSGAPWWRPYLSASFLHHYILPYATIVIKYMYFPILLMRTNVVEVMGQDHFYYNRITGLPRLNRLRHLMKNASLPLVTLYPISMGRAIGGLVLIEVVFNWPGIGFALVNSVSARDLPVAQFVFFLIAIWVIVGNFVVDLLYGVIDPRVTLGEGEAS